MNVRTEEELYEPMRKWLEQHLKDKYKGFDVVAVDTHSERLDRVFQKYKVPCEMANGVDIEIDVLGIARKGLDFKIAFIEAKKTRLVLRDLGQLWAYCKLVDPDEAYLFSSLDLGSLNKILNVFKREDLLDFGKGKIIKKMIVGKWNIVTNSPDALSLVPRI